MYIYISIYNMYLYMHGTIMLVVPAALRNPDGAAQLIQHLHYNHPEVDRIWDIQEIHDGSLKDHILSTPGWLQLNFPSDTDQEKGALAPCVLNPPKTRTNTERHLFKASK